MRKKMRCLPITAPALLVLVSVTMSVALAESPHYKPKGGPNCADNGLTMTCTGTIAGLSNFDVTATLDFPSPGPVNTATGTTNCTNPGGSSKVPGQNPALPLNVSVTVFLGKPKNGTLSFTVTTCDPNLSSCGGPPSPAAAGCPNSSWTAEFTDVVFPPSSGTLTIKQTPDGVNFNTVLSTIVP